MNKLKRKLKNLWTLFIPVRVVLFMILFIPITALCFLYAILLIILTDIEDPIETAFTPIDVMASWLD